MNEQNRIAKIYLKNLAPNEAIDLINKYNIPSPHKEVLISACVYNRSSFEGCDFVAENYKIHISYWDFVKKLKEALVIFRKSQEYNNQKSSKM